MSKENVYINGSFRDKDTRVGVEKNADQIDSEKDWCLILVQFQTSF